MNIDFNMHFLPWISYKANIRDESLEQDGGSFEKYLLKKICCCSG